MPSRFDNLLNEAAAARKDAEVRLAAEKQKQKQKQDADHSLSEPYLRALGLKVVQKLYQLGVPPVEWEKWEPGLFRRRRIVLSRHWKFEESGGEPEIDRWNRYFYLAEDGVFCSRLFRGVGDGDFERHPLHPRVAHRNKRGGAFYLESVPITKTDFSGTFVDQKSGVVYITKFGTRSKSSARLDPGEYEDMEEYIAKYVQWRMLR